MRLLVFQLRTHIHGAEHGEISAATKIVKTSET